MVKAASASQAPGRHPSNQALAADLVWRATTYFPPVFLGIVTYVLWRRGLDKGIYTDRPVAGSA